METVLTEIIERLRAGETLTERDVIHAIDLRNREISRQSAGPKPPRRPLMKRQLLPFYLNAKEHDPDRWRAWRVNDDLEGALVELLRVKPRRSASGVATITVLTKPWPCSGACLYCPQDIRMPKSYLADEPACRRAEGLWFDPYLQVATRLEHLRLMGHATNKVQLIVAGGTWHDYPEAYRLWFANELVRAVNDAVSPEGRTRAEERAARYEAAGLARDRETLKRETAALQAAIDDGTLTYNEAFAARYGPTSRWARQDAWQRAGWEEVEDVWAANATAPLRVIGLSIETRPELIDDNALVELGRLGVTRVQIGLQSLDEPILTANGRSHPLEACARAFRRLRDGGFIIHGHYMLNLPGSDPERDRAGFRQLVDDPAFRPDEVKLYPCVLVKSAPLHRLRADAGWAPYGEEELITLMAELLRIAPPWLRISRMVRDISAHDIVAGSHRANARQLVEAEARASGAPIAELRTREIGTDDAGGRAWRLVERRYATSSGDEWFLSWEDAEDRVLAYARLTLGTQAQVREVHELGADAAANVAVGSRGRALIDRARAIARDAGYEDVTLTLAGPRPAG